MLGLVGFFWFGFFLGGWFFFFEGNNKFFHFAVSSCLKIEIVKLFLRLTSVNTEGLLGAKN